MSQAMAQINSLPFLINIINTENEKAGVNDRHIQKDSPTSLFWQLKEFGIEKNSVNLKI